MTTERGRSFAESGPRGGSDLWDDDVGGSILTVEFFGSPPAPPSGLQAARFDAAADTLTMPAAAVPSGSGAWTVAVWGRLAVDLNVPTMLWSFDAIFSSGWHALETDSSGTSLRFYDTGVTIATIGSLTVGQWYFIVVRKSAAGSIKTYLGDEAFGALSTATGTVTNMTYAGDGYVGGSAYGDYLDGRLWGMRVWDAELSDAEIDAEFAASDGSAVRTSNLRAQWKLDSDTSPGTDSSGNARHLTNAGGSWTLEAGPTFPAGGGTMSPAIFGALTGVSTVSLATTISIGTAGVLTGAQTPTTSASIGLTTTGVLTGSNTPSTAASISGTTAGVLTGLNTPSTAASVGIGTAGVLTGLNAVTTAALVSAGTAGVLTGLNAVTLGAAGTVTPAVFGVLTGSQSPSLAATVALGTAGALTDVQSPTLAAGIAASRAEVLTGLSAVQLAAGVVILSAGVLTGSNAPSLGAVATLGSMPGVTWLAVLQGDDAVGARLVDEGVRAVLQSNEHGVAIVGGATNIARVT